MPLKGMQSWRIGDLVEACEDGYRAGCKRKPYRLPSWVAGSPTLQEAYRVGYDNARRKEAATDGTAR